MAPTTFVLLHGSLVGPWCWDRVGTALTAAGHQVAAPALPFADARARSAEHLEAIVADPQVHDAPPPSLTFVAHSMAGLLAPAIAARFPGTRIVYLAAFLPSPGRSLVDQLDDEPEMLEPAWARWGAPPVWEDPARARHFLFHDTDERTAAQAIARLVPNHPALAVERAPAGWPAVRADLICPGQDRTIRPSWMRHVARTRVGAAAHELNAGHCPQITQPEPLARLLGELVGEARPATLGDISPGG